MHRTVCRRAYLLSRHLHTSAGRLAGGALRAGVKAAAAPVVVRKGSLFDPDPATAPPPTSQAIEQTAHALPPETAEEVEQMEWASRAKAKLIRTLGDQTVNNLLVMIPADLVKKLSEMCIYATLDQLVDYCKQNIFGYLREEPKSRANGMFLIADLMIPTTKVSTSVKHKLRMAGRNELDKLWVFRTGKSPPMEIDTLQTPLEEEKAEEHFSRLDVDYYNFRLEHGDCLANFGMAVMEERQIRTKVELDKEFLVDLDEPRKRLLNYLDEAIEHNFGAAAFKAGSLFEEGIVLPLEGEKAVEYYEKALALGYTYAAVRLGYLYKSGPMSLKGQPKVKSDRRKSLEYFEMAAEKWPAAALQVAQAYYRRHGFTSEEHSRTYQTDPNDEKAAHLFSLAADKNSWISARMLSDILLMDRADVPKRRMDDAKRQQPKRVRQLEYAVALLKSIPQSDQKKCFIIGWDDSYKLACRLLEAAKKGNRAMDFDPVKLTSWTKWSPAFKAIGPPRNSRRSNGAAGIRKHISEAEKKSIEEKRREVLMGSLMSQVKVRLKGGPPKRSPTRPRATIASGPGV